MRPVAIAAILALLGACNSRGHEGPIPTPDPLPAAREGRTLIHVGKEGLWVRLARTEDDRQRGLQGVASLPEDEGMLFLYDDYRPRRFWMKGCLLDLDVAFLDQSGAVVDVQQVDAPPADAPDHLIPRAISPGSARAVLEVNRGWFESRGLQRGVRIAEWDRLLSWGSGGR